MISPEQRDYYLSILRLIAEGVHYAGDIAAQLDINSSSVSGYVSGMKVKGWVDSVRCKKRNVAKWTLKQDRDSIEQEIMKLSQIIKLNTKSKPKQIEGEPDIGITDEDLAWQAHYKQKWRQRYLQAGKVPPKV